MCSVSDWLGRFNSAIVVQSLAVAVGFGIFRNVGSNEQLLYVFAAFWGFANGAVLGLMSPLLGEYVLSGVYLPTSTNNSRLCDPEDFGRYLSASSSVNSIA